MQTLTAISQGVVLGGGQMNCSSPFTPVNPLGQRPTFSCFRGRAFDCCGKRENFSAFLRGHARSFNCWFLWIAGDVREKGDNKDASKRAWHRRFLNGNVQ